MCFRGSGARGVYLDAGGRGQGLLTAALQTQAFCAGSHSGVCVCACCVICGCAWGGGARLYGIPAVSKTKTKTAEITHTNTKIHKHAITPPPPSDFSPARWYVSSARYEGVSNSSTPAAHRSARSCVFVCAHARVRVCERVLFSCCVCL